MAFGITNKLTDISPDFMVISQSTAAQFVSTATSTNIGVQFHQEFADYTTTGPIPLSSQIVAGFGPGDFGVAHNQYRALIFLKGLTGTTGPPMMATLEAATSTGLSPVYLLDSKAVSGTSTQASLFLFGTMPIAAGARFARVNFIAATTAAAVSSSTATDAIIEGI